MLSIVAGDGGMGRTVAAALAGRGTPPLTILGMPESGAGHPSSAFAGAEVLFDFTVGDAVLRNVEAALEGGVRRFIIGTTNWAADRDSVERLLVQHGAAAVASAIVQSGRHAVCPSRRGSRAALRPVRRLRPLPRGVAPPHQGRSAFRHRPRNLAPPDRRPSPQDARGTADGPRRPGPRRAGRHRDSGGSRPGHAPRRIRRPGESLEMRLTARDRSAYAAGAITAAEWLLGARAARIPQLRLRGRLDHRQTAGRPDGHEIARGTATQPRHSAPPLNTATQPRHSTPPLSPATQRLHPRHPAPTRRHSPPPTKEQPRCRPPASSEEPSPPS
jgi:hypothetical protein